MISSRRMLSAVILSVIIGAFFAFSKKGERQYCVAGPLPQDSSEVGIEIVNPLGKEVWATRDWAPSSFQEFSFPIHWLFWQKNDPRRLIADSGQILRSPGCEQDGKYNRMRAFGRDFMQPVRLMRLRSYADEERLIRRVTLEKYHALTYKAGRQINILNAPDGSRYILVAQTAFHRTAEPTLPSGWQLTNHILEEELQITLSGIIDVLRTDNQDSFQGPIPNHVRF